MKIKEDELPEWYFPYNDNYTGMFWSNGQFQESVCEGDRDPLTKLDAISKRHDNAYCKAKPSGNLDLLDDADLAYWQDTRSMSLGPRVIGNMVYYGNKLGRLPYRIGVGGRSKMLRGMYQNDSAAAHRAKYENLAPRPRLATVDRLPNEAPITPSEVYLPGKQEDQFVYQPNTGTCDGIIHGPTNGSGFENGSMIYNTPRSNSQWNPFWRRRKRKKNKIYIY